MSAQNIHFRSLGIRIDDKTSKEEVARLVAKYPEVRRAFAKIEAAKSSPKTTKADGESK